MEYVCATMEKYFKTKPITKNRTVTFHLRQIRIIPTNSAATFNIYEQPKNKVSVQCLSVDVDFWVQCGLCLGWVRPPSRTRRGLSRREEGRTHESAGHLASGPHLEPDALSRRAARRILFFFKTSKRRRERATLKLCVIIYTAAVQSLPAFKCCCCAVGPDVFNMNH